jgi:hypothetical protein
VSNWSRLFIVPYSICGTPLFFYLLINASKSLTSTIRRLYVKLVGDRNHFQPLPPATPTRYGEPRRRPTPNAAIDMVGSDSDEDDRAERLDKIRKWGAGVVPPVTSSSGCQTDFGGDEKNEGEEIPRRDYSRMNGSVPTGSGNSTWPPVFSVENESQRLQAPSWRRLSRILSPTVRPLAQMPTTDYPRPRSPPSWIYFSLFLLWYATGYLLLAFWQGLDHETAFSLPLLIIFSTHFGHYASQTQKSSIFRATMSIYAVFGMVFLFLCLYSVYVKSKTPKYPRPWQRTVWL